MTFTTQTETINSGTVSLTFNLPASAIINDNIYISSLSNIKYRFDIPKNDKNPTSIGSKSGSVKVSLMQKARGNELFEAFQTLAPSERFFATLNFTERNSGFSGSLPFFLERSSVDYDNIKDILTINLNPFPLIYITTANDGTFIEGSISDYFNGTYNAELYGAAPTIYTRTDNSLDAVTANSFVSDVLSLITRQTVPQGSSRLNTATDSWYVTKQDDYTLSEMLGVIASLQGSVYGAFFGEFFYSQRNLSSPSVTLDWADVENVKDDAFYQSEYRSVSVSQDFPSAVTVTEGGTVLNKYGEKNFSVSFVSNGLFKGEPPAGTTVTPRSYVTSTELVEDGYDGYLKALGANGNDRLELDILKFNGIKPYSKINFNTDAPSDYQGSTFAISEIEYDLIKYKIKAKVYKI